MQNELNVLNSIEKNKDATQRDIAKSTGMSLGNVNILIKRLVNKGLIKIEKLNSKSIRYILTPQGLKEKAEKTYEYVVTSFRYINEINTKIDHLICSQDLREGDKVCLVGEKDEIFYLLKDKLDHYKIFFYSLEKAAELDMQSSNAQPSALSSQLFIVWHPETEELLNSQNVLCINLLNHL